MILSNETISKNDQERIEALGLEKFNYDNPIEMYKWTISRDRTTFLLPIYGNNREGHQWLMVLVIDDSVIPFWTDRTIEKDNFGQSIAHYLVTDVQTPRNLHGRKTDIYRKISEALDALGLSYSRQGVSAVKVEIKD